MPQILDGHPILERQELRDDTSGLWQEPWLSLLPDLPGLFSIAEMVD